MLVLLAQVLVRGVPKLLSFGYCDYSSATRTRAAAKEWNSSAQPRQSDLAGVIRAWQSQSFERMHTLQSGPVLQQP